MPIDPNLMIQLDDYDLLTRPPSILLYGPPGAGKTVCAAQTDQNLLWLTSGPTNLRSYASWLRDNVEIAASLGMKMPSRKYIGKLGSDGVTRVANRAIVTDIIQRYATSVIAGTCSYTGLVLDEYSEFSARFYDEIKEDPALGRNAFAKIDALKSFNAWICQFPRFTQHMLILIAHEVEPKYDLEQGSPTYNQLKYRGGPSFPIGTEIHTMSAASDICLRIRITKSGNKIKRSFQTEVDPLWVSKFRDFSVKPETDNLDLRALLEGAGYKMR